MLEIVKGKKRFLKLFVIILVTFILIFSASSMIFVKIIYDKQFSRHDKPAVSAYLTYADIKGYDRSIVKFKSGKNNLTGYIYGEENKKGLVVIAHGLGGGAENYLPETLYLVDKGWRVFSYDCTGSYESEGDGTVGLPQSLKDLDAALAFIESNNAMKDLPIMLYGHSWGGYAVTSILNYNHQVAASVSISAFNSPNDLLFEQAKSMMGLFAYVEYPFLWAYQTMLFGKTALTTSVEGINKTNIPVMIIHGDKDETIAYDGASVIAQRNKIVNPNVIYKTCSDENRNGHNNLLQSETGSKYFKEINKEYKEVYNSYSGKIPEDIKNKFYEVIDRHKTSELNINFMDEINSFYEKQLKKS
jgi:alpha-beta hydrolase superfamily lysophospholipase